MLVKEGAPLTLMNIVAVLDKPPESVTLTRKLLVPLSAMVAVPESMPLVATSSHVGPLTFAKVSKSPGLGSVAWLVMDAE